MVKPLETELRALTTLERVVHWARDLNPAGEIVNVVTQDEYTHDVVVSLPGGTFAVFDTT